MHLLFGVNLGVDVFHISDQLLNVVNAVFAVLAIFGRNLKSALGVIGNISIGGAIERALNFNDRVSMLSENGAKNVLVPMDNLTEMATLPATILGKTDIPFYANTQMLIQKMI